MKRIGWQTRITIAILALLSIGVSWSNAFKTPDSPACYGCCK